MMAEPLVLLITAYLYANAVIAPLVIVYLLMDTRRVSLAAALRFHQLLVVATVILPLVLFAASFDGPRALEARIPFVGSSVVEPAPVERNPVERNSVESGSVDANRRLPGSSIDLSSSAPTVNDLVFILGEVVVWLSLAGLVVFVVRYARQATRVSRLVTGAIAVERRGGVLVVRSAQTALPFSVGCVAKRVLVPDWMDPATAAVVIRHELNHFACGHHVWSVAEAVLAHVFWFNPVSHLLRRRGRFFRELECDARTIQSVDKFEYARILVESAERIVARRPAFTAGGHAWVDRDRLGKRIAFILGEPRSSRRTAFNVVAVASFAVAATALVLAGNVNDRLSRDEILETVNERYAEILGSRVRVELERVPPELVQALLIEYDPRFHDHHGIEVLCTAWRAVHRGLLGSLDMATSTRCRGSTLTQQLARTFLRDSRPSIERKLRELRVTRVLEDSFSKDELLQMYLNTVFFGNRAYGLAEAAERYFDKAYIDLTREESAMLVPFLAAPSVANLRADAETAVRNQQRLLGMMDEIGEPVW